MKTRNVTQLVLAAVVGGVVMTSAYVTVHKLDERAAKDSIDTVWTAPQEGFSAEALEAVDFEEFPMTLLDSAEQEIPFELHWNVAGLRNTDGSIMQFRSTEEHANYLQYIIKWKCNPKAKYTTVEEAVEEVYSYVNETSLEYFRGGEVY